MKRQQVKALRKQARALVDAIRLLRFDHLQTMLALRELQGNEHACVRLRGQLTKLLNHQRPKVRDETPRVIDKNPMGSGHRTDSKPDRRGSEVTLPKTGELNGPKNGGVSVSTAPKTGVFPNQPAIRLPSHADSNCHEGEAS